MRYVTYLIYIVAFETLVLGGTGYAVFVLNRNPQWFILAILISFCAYKPGRWAELSNGSAKK